MLGPIASLLALASLAAADSVVTNNASSWYSTVAPYQTFNSAPDLQPPEVNILTYDAERVSSNATFLSYRGTAVTQPAPIIMDNNGSLVWSGGSQYGDSMDLIVQRYKGEDVLTFFQGSFYSAGYGEGYWNMLSTNYTSIRNVTALNQTTNEADFHEFFITENDTALVESWRLTQADLTGANGTSDGWTWDCVFQEVDISGDNDTLLFEWRSLEHVSPSETYFEVNGNGNSSENAFDYCHINSLEKVTDTSYLVSLRGPSTIYHISQETGEILWRLGGKNSSFVMEGNATFWYQHDARLMTGQDITASKFNISLFDNAAGGGAPAESSARALILELDTDALTATVVYEFFPSFNNVAPSQGSVQPLDNSNYFVGWGAVPYFSEYAEDGTLLQDVQFGTTENVVMSYRAFKQAWTAYPLTVPSLAVNGSSAFASWNGATEVTRWQLLGGTSETGVTTTVTLADKSGFETELAGLNGTYTFLAAAALSSNGTCLGVSNVYSTSSMSSTSTNGTCPTGTTVAAAGSGSSSSSKTSGASKFSTGRLAGVLLVVAGTAVWMA
ncbi:hypothetical protein JCM5296_000795 [Sporobolomyces johnsonii]